MRKRLYKKMPGYWVFHYSNTTKDIFDESRWNPNRPKLLHKWLGRYIKRYRDENGKVLRTGGSHHSRILARQIFNRFLGLVKEDMIEENDFFYLPNGDYIGHKTVYVYNPDTLNRRVHSFLELSEHSKKKIGNNYKFVFDHEGLKRLTAKIKVNVNSKCFSKNHYLDAGSKSQEFSLAGERYRRMVWGMP